MFYTDEDRADIAKQLKAQGLRPANAHEGEPGWYTLVTVRNPEEGRRMAVRVWATDLPVADPEMNKGSVPCGGCFGVSGNGCSSCSTTLGYFARTQAAR